MPYFGGATLFMIGTTRAAASAAARQEEKTAPIGPDRRKKGNRRGVPVGRRKHARLRRTGQNARMKGMHGGRQQQGQAPVLSDVTVCAANSVSPELAGRALDISAWSAAPSPRRSCSRTCRRPATSATSRFPKLASLDDYSRFCLKEMGRHIRTASCAGRAVGRLRRRRRGLGQALPQLRLCRRADLPRRPRGGRQWRLLAQEPQADAGAGQAADGAGRQRGLDDLRDSQADAGARLRHPLRPARNGRPLLLRAAPSRQADLRLPRPVQLLPPRKRRRRCSPSMPACRRRR